jgi:hypothetical protein
MGRQPWSHRRIVEECETLSSYRVKEWRGRIQKIGGTEVLPLSYYVGDNWAATLKLWFPECSLLNFESINNRSLLIRG